MPATLREPPRNAVPGVALSELSGTGVAAAVSRELLLAISLANLCFYGVWHQLLFAQPFYMPLWSWRDLLAITLNVSALAAVFWLAIMRRRTRAAGAWHWSSGLSLLPALIFLNLLRLRYWSRLRAALDDDLLLLLLAVAAALLCAYVLARWPGKVLAGAEVLTLWLFAFVPMTFGQAAWMLHQPQLPVTAMAPALPPSPLRPRVLWIVFDEMDWRPVFGGRPPTLALPELDRLRAQSLDVAPAIQTGLVTAPAMASLIYGRQVYDVQPAGPSELQLNFVPQGDYETWPPQHNLFAHARQAGFNTAAVGWFLPYCRMFAVDLTRCYWESMYAGVVDGRPSLLASVRNQWLTLSPLEGRQRHLLRHQNLMREAQRAAVDSNLGFVLIHLAVPHEPAIYDRHTGGFTAVSFQKDWYLDNLALADRSLGELRHAMESAGLWERTTVLVTSDHSLRHDAVSNPHTGAQIPFLLKLAGQQGGMTYQQPTSNLAAHDLTLALLRSELDTSQEVTHWLDQRVGQAPQGVPPPSPARQ